MPTQDYRIDGERIPGCTTITGRFKDSGALIAWAYNQGKEGKDFRKTKEDAADAGTLAHAMIEADWHGTTVDLAKYDKPIVEKAEHAFLAYLEWKQQTQLRIVQAELSLISKIHRFGGTMDAVMANDRLWLADYKTASGVYTDMLIQVAGGYGLLWQEHFPDQELAGIQILRFSKPNAPEDPVSFHQHFYTAEIFPIAQRQFLLFRDAYDLDKRLKKLI